MGLWVCGSGPYPLSGSSQGSCLLNPAPTSSPPVADDVDRGNSSIQSANHWVNGTHPATALTSEPLLLNFIKSPSSPISELFFSIKQTISHTQPQSLQSNTNHSKTKQIKTNQTQNGIHQYVFPRYYYYPSPSPTWGKVD